MTSTDHPSARVVHQIGAFLDSKDLASMIFVNKDWMNGLQHGSYCLFFEAQKHCHPEALSSFLKFFRNASTIRFHNVSTNDSRMEEFPQLLERYKSIEIFDCSLARDFSQMPLPNLRSFALHNTNESGGRILQALSPWSHLQHLSLNQCVGIRSIHVEKIIQQCCPVLQSLTIVRAFDIISPSLLTPSISIGDSGSHSTVAAADPEFRNICRFRRLSFCECPLLSLESLLADGDSIDGARDSSAMSFPHLEYLNLSRTAVSISVVQQLLQYQQLRTPSLETLILDGCLQLSPVLQLSHIPLLRSLSFRQCACLAKLELSNVACLQILDLHFCENLQQLHLSDLPHLPALSLIMMRKLEILVLVRCLGLKNLNLTGCEALAKSGSFLDYVASESELAFKQKLMSSEFVPIDSKSIDDRATVSEDVCKFLAMLHYNCPQLSLLPWIENCTCGTSIFQERKEILFRLKHIISS
jgi:hypothetical protein